MKLITNSQKWNYTRLRTRIVTLLEIANLDHFYMYFFATFDGSTIPDTTRGEGKKKTSYARLRQNLLSPCGDLI
jgi:hypothetical protein